MTLTRASELGRHLVRWRQFATRGVWLVVLSSLVLDAGLRWGLYAEGGDGPFPGSD